MNGTDLLCCTVTQMINPARLAAFAATVVSDGPIVAAPILTEAQHEHVLTGRYELVPTSTGVTGRTESGEMSMSWASVATLLAAATTPEHARALSDAVTVGGRPRGPDRKALDAACADYAHAAATAAGLIDPPMARESENGFNIELRSTVHRSTVSINDVEVLSVSPDQSTTEIDVPAHSDPTTGEQIDRWSETVVFVPRRESNSPTPTSVGHRVGIQPWTPLNDIGARWSLQIDGFDIVIINASPRSGVNISVYDEDPSHDYLRFDTSFEVPQRPSPAQNRVAALKVPQMGREL